MLGQTNPSAGYLVGVVVGAHMSSSYSPFVTVKLSGVEMSRCCGGVGVNRDGSASRYFLLIFTAVWTG